MLFLARTVKLSTKYNGLSVDNWIVSYLVRSLDCRIGPFWPEASGAVRRRSVN